MQLPTFLTSSTDNSYFDPMFNRLSIYFVAHQDDWQLFMDPNISKDITDAKCRTVIVHVTAGDAGNGRDFWLAREMAAVASLVFRKSQEDIIIPAAGYRSCFKKNIRVWEIDNCICYFLRLPDGDMDGEGFEKYRYQSLDKLRSASLDFISSVDSCNIYESFGQLVRVIENLVENELCNVNIQSNKDIILHIPEFIQEINPGDHNDHFNTSLLVQSTKYYDRFEKFAYKHYDIKNSCTDLTGEALFWKMGMFAVYHQEVLRLQGYSTINESAEYLQWAMRDQSYRRIL